MLGKPQLIAITSVPRQIAECLKSKDSGRYAGYATFCANVCCNWWGWGDLITLVKLNGGYT